MGTFGRNALRLISGMIPVNDYMETMQYLSPGRDAGTLLRVYGDRIYATEH